MRITVELETSDGLVSPFENMLINYIASQFHTENAPVAETPSVEEEKPAPKRKRATRAKKKEEPKAEEPKAEEPKAEEPKAEEPKDPKELLAHATALASEMMQNGDVAVLKRLLTTVGAERISRMNEEQTARFLKLAKAENYA
nr:MAG TPA: hypothetical protein [Caudoviricetes sp.]